MKLRAIRRTKAWLVKPSTRRALALKTMAKAMLNTLNTPAVRWWDLSEAIA